MVENHCETGLIKLTFHLPNDSCEDQLPFASLRLLGSYSYEHFHVDMRKYIGKDAQIEPAESENKLGR